MTKVNQRIAKTISCAGFAICISHSHSMAQSKSVSGNAPPVASQLARALSAFIHRYNDTDFGKVIRLGSDRLPAELAKMNIEIVPDYDKFGTYYAAAATWTRTPYMKIKNTNTELFENVKTLWHETMHHMVALAGGAPCPQEESYMSLNEDRIEWLDKLRQFERRYNSRTVSPKELKANWKDLEALWGNKNRRYTEPIAEIGGPAVQNLSGPYWGQDADDTCGEGRNKWSRVDPAFVQKWDSTIGIDINLRKIRSLYKALDMPDIIAGKLHVRVLKAASLEPLSGAAIFVTGGTWRFRKTSERDGVEFNVPVTDGVPEDIAHYIMYQIRVELAGYQTVTRGDESVFADPSPAREIVVVLQPAQKSEAKGQGWSGTWVADRTTYNISSTGNSLSASFQFNFPGAYYANSKGSGQWSNCTIEGDTARCHWTMSYEDDAKTAKVSGIVGVTLSGDIITGGTTITESSITWKNGPRSTDLGKGGVGKINLKRAKP